MPVWCVWLAVGGQVRTNSMPGILLGIRDGGVATETLGKACMLL
jgi:hypothetical protein